MIAEVTNTPWGERHAYVLAADGRVVRTTVAKRMHVSPFMGMEQSYRVVAVASRARGWRCGSTNSRGPRPSIEAALSLQRVELTRAR